MKFYFFILLMFATKGICDNPGNPFAQLVRKTLKLTARNCMRQVNATETDLEALRGEPPFPETSACILKCLFERIGIVRSNKFSKVGFMGAIKPVVLRNREKLEHMRTVSENCDREINIVTQPISPCHVGNAVTSCIFKYAPELHLKS